MPVNFTCLYKDKLNDVDDTAGDVGMSPGTGWLLFTPNFPPGARIPFGLDTGIGPRAFPGYLDADGQLKPNPGGSIGLRLWANDPQFGIQRFEYHVTARDGFLKDQYGRAVHFRGFYFDAPPDDRIVYLRNELPAPGQRFNRGRPGFGIAGTDVDTDFNLVLTRDDGTELDPVEIPVSAAAAAAYALTFGR